MGSGKSKSDQELFDPSDVNVEFPPTRRRDEVLIRLKAQEGAMNLMKTYLALKIICEKIEGQLNILGEADTDILN